jgi:DNA polymerase III sliding clamp (beta) subunit (PCNA family)
MQFPKNCKIENSLSTDPTRPHLVNAWYDVDTRTLTACDGWRLARIGVTVDAGDHTGWITADAIKAARKTATKGSTHATILANGALAVPGGPTFTRPVDGTPPPYDQVIPNPFSEAKPARSAFWGVNADYLSDAKAALGCKNGVSIYQYGGALDPVIITPMSWESEADFKVYKQTGICVVMPMRL